MKYELKLFWLLTLLVALPCILLSAFALRSLVGQKSIIEKNIEESYSALASNTRKHMMEKVAAKIKIVDKCLSTELSQQKELLLSLFQLPLQDPFFSGFYLLDKEGNILYPEGMPKISESQNTFAKIENYKYFEAAFLYEFQKKDYPAAIAEYQKIVAQLSEQNLEELGQALTAIARCYWKDNKLDKARESYLSLIVLFRDRKDTSSLSVTIDAKKQIAEIYRLQNNFFNHYQILLELLEYLILHEFCLPRSQYIYHYRKITESLSLLAQEERISRNDKEIFEKSYEKILEGKKRLLARELELKHIRQYVIPELKKKDISPLSGYIAYQPLEQQKLIYYRQFSKSQGEGYLLYNVNLEYCLHQILMPVLQGQDVGRDMKLVLRDYTGAALGQTISSDYFSIVSQPLHPAFPFWQIAIYLKNVRSLEELSRYQSQLYFWGLITVILVLLVGVYTIITTFVREVKSARLKSNFVSNVTHELKTPLTAIKMFVETLLMERAKTPEEQKEYLQIISSESDRLSRLIDRILNFARMEQKRRKFHFSSVDAGNLVENVVKNFQNQIHDASCKMQVTIEPKMPQVMMDAEAISEAVVNLLSNAYKYNDKYARKIDVRIFKIGADKIGISVKDNGIGIARHEFHRIFRKFYRIEDTLTRKIEGTGLGLSLVESIAKAHRGKVRLQSKLGQGSEFTIVFPIQRKEN